MAKTRRAAKSTAKPRKKAVLNLKKLARDIENAKEVLRKRHETTARKASKQVTAAQAERYGRAGEQLTSVQSVLDRWAGDIATLCADPNGEPCGPDMIITS